MNINNLSDIKKRYLQLRPVNASSGGVYSFRNGLPIVKFDISASMNPLMMDGSDLRITGRLTARKNDGTAIIGNALAATETNFIDGFAGISHLIDHVTISSKRLNTVIERVTNYARLAPAITSALNSMNEFESNLCHGNLNHSTVPLTRHGLNCYSEINSSGVTGFGARGSAGQLGQDFSAQLYTGVLQSGQMIDLSNQSGVGGLVIEILLKSDVNCVFGTDAAANTASYTIRDLMLTVPVYEMHGAGAMARQQEVNQFQFNSWQSMFQTVNSSTSVVAFTPGLASVTSVLTNYITASELGNQAFNACRLGPIGELQAVRWARNGALYPMQFRNETVEQQNNDTAKINAGDAFSSHLYQVRAEPFRYSLEGIMTKRNDQIHSTMVSWDGWSAGCVDRPQNAGNDGIRPTTADSLAVLYDAYGAGVNFQNTVWSCELNVSGTSQLQVADATPGPVVNVANNLDGTAATAQAITIYFLSKNTIMMSQAGIDILR